MDGRGMSDMLLWVIAVAFVVGGALGSLWSQVRAARRSSELSAALEVAKAQVASAEQGAAAQIALLSQSEARLHSAFDELAAQSLRANGELFLNVARETLGREQAVAQGVLKERETAISQMIEPLRTALARTEAQVESLERERREAFTTLRTQIESLSSGQGQLARETRNLVTALRRPEVRGRWGELTLRRVVELAGMVEHCDFTEQVHVSTEQGASRPDLVVHMPEARDLVVDVKTPLDAYLEALEATTDEARNAALARHARQLEARIRELGRKEYWAQFERSPDFAVLFLPGDQFLSAALAEKPDLIDTALKQSIILATPSTLMALLKVVAYGWRQAHVAENAATIRDLGQELHRRLSTFANHLSKVGRGLSGAVDSYNAAVGSLERNVLPQARRFTELGVTADAPIPSLETMENLTRSIDPRTALEPGDAGANPESNSEPGAS